MTKRYRMMHIRTYTLLALAAMLLAVSCEMTREMENPEHLPDHGVLSLEVQADQGNTLVQAKSLLINPNNFAVTLYKGAADGEVYKSFPTYTDLKQQAPLQLPVGTYYVRAHYGEPKNVSTLPYYEGGQQVVIGKGATTETVLTCKMQNVKVQLVLNAAFVATFEHHTIMVTNADKAIYTYLDNPNPEPIYFKITEGLKEITLIIAAKTYEGKEYQFTRVLSKPEEYNQGLLQPGDYFNVELGVEADPIGAMQMSVVVDLGMNERSDTIEVVVDDDVKELEPNPGPTPGALSVVVQGHADIDEPIVFEQGQEPQVVILIEAAKGIDELKVRIESPFLTAEELAGVGLSTEFDLANLKPGEEGLADILAFDNMKGATSTSFDISMFMGMLPPGTHKFHVAIKDTQGTVLSKTITVQVIGN